MKWDIRPINLEDVASIAIQGRELAKSGNPIVEQTRCIYMLDDPKIIYMIPLLDYIDDPPEKISKFFLGQVVT